MEFLRDELNRLGWDRARQDRVLRQMNKTRSGDHLVFIPQSKQMVLTQKRRDAGVLIKTGGTGFADENKTLFTIGRNKVFTEADFF